MRDFRTGKNAFLSPLSPLSRPSSYFRDPHESAKSHLLFCWTFIPAIIAFFEAIYYIAIGEAGFRKLIEQGRH
jgi:hypothetical protein